MKSVKKKRTTLIKWTVLVLMIVAVFLFLRNRKEMLLREFSHFLGSSLSRGAGVSVQIGKISGNLLGSVRFQDIRGEAPWLPEGQNTLFKVKEIQFHYRFFDFLSKKFDSKLEVTVQEPELTWQPRVSLKKPDFLFLEWMERWALSQRKHLVMRVEKMRLLLGVDKAPLSGIDLFYEDNGLRAEIPLSHITVGDLDISSMVQLEGHYEPGTSDKGGALRGTIRTEGTVINWKPLPKESQFDFVFSKDIFSMTSVNFLGGVELAGQIDFAKDYEVDLSIKAVDFPLSTLDPFLVAKSRNSSPGRVDIDTHFYGSPWAANVESRTRIYHGFIGNRIFKVMDVNVEGVYPTVNLTNSKIQLEDGAAMRFADKTLEAADLFKEKTYEMLIKEAQQEVVVWGDWEFSRPRDINDQPEFLMQRSLSSQSRVHFRKWNDESEESFDPSKAQPMEVGFEYRLRSKDSLKLELRDNEEFVGVERKMKF